MAATIYLQVNRGMITPNDPASLNMTRVAGIAGGQTLRMDTTAGGTEIPAYWLSGSNPLVGHYSERIAAEVTLSQAITITADSVASANGLKATFRFRLSKITAGGSNIETLIGQVDGASEITTTTAHRTFVLTPSTAIVLAPNERLVLRVSAIPVAGQTMVGGGNLTVRFGGPSAGFFETKLDFLDTPTFLDAYTQFLLRRTAVAAIGNFFDLLPTRGVSAFTTGVVNTAAGPAEVQWTRTAGGTVLEFVSPRFAGGWNFQPTTNVVSVQAIFWALESATTANATIRFKLWRRRGTTETLFLNVARGTELGTSAAIQSITDQSAGASATPMDFLPDDRIVLRVYVTDATSLTMASGRTATLNYDHSAANVNGDSYISLLDTATLKAEADADASQAIPGGMSTFGVGNDGA